MSSSLREIADTVNGKPGPVRIEEELYNFFRKTIDSGILLNKAKQGYYSHRIFFKTFRDFVWPHRERPYLTSEEGKKLVPFHDFKATDGNDITATLVLNCKRDSEKYEWFLSHERTSCHYDPHIDIYMEFKW